MRITVFVLLLLLPVGLRAQAPAPDGLPVGLMSADSQRVWVQLPGTADTVRLKQLIALGQHHLDTNFDSARMLGQAAVALAWRRGQGPGLVQGLSLLATAYYHASNSPAAQRTYEQLLWAARRARQPEMIGSAYMGLGNVARQLDNWAGAEHYFAQAQQTYAAARPRNIKGELAVLANRAYNFLDVDSVARARPLVRQAVALLRQYPQARRPAKYRLLLGMIQLKDQQLDSAAVTFRRAARLARETHDVNAEAEALLYLAEMALQKPDYPLALRQARQAEILFHGLGDPQDANALKTQAAALAGMHRPEAYATLRRYMTLYEKAVGMQRAEEVTTAQARFTQTEQQARIRDLEQQRRIADLEAQQRTVRSRVLLGGLAVAVLGLSLAGLYVYRRRQERRERALRNQLAADLHDDVGTLLSQIALQTDLLQEGLAPPGEQHLHWAAVAGNSRMAVRQLNDVVWNLDAHNDTVPGLLDRLRDYAHEVLVPTGRDVRFVTGDGLDTAPDLLPAVRRQLYLIYKEALHNIIKHTPPDATVTVTLRNADGLLDLEIVNSGPVPVSVGRSSGHGLRNMQLRATALGGTAMAEALAAGGFAVRVRVPV